MKIGFLTTAMLICSLAFSLTLNAEEVQLNPNPNNDSAGTENDNKNENGEEKSENKPQQKIKGIVLDREKREVRVDATVCLDSGILEFLICTPNSFEHESIFKMECKPSALHLYLLLLDIQPKMFDGSVLWFANAQKKAESHVKIEVAYEKDGKTLRQPVSKFMVNRESKDGEIKDTWIFTGSGFFKKGEKEVYAADSMGAVVGFGPKAAPTLQYSEEIGLAYHGDEEGVEVDEDNTPAIGTKVQLIFTPIKQATPEKETKKEDVKAPKTTEKTESTPTEKVSP